MLQNAALNRLGVILFTGHRIDNPARETPRFPVNAEDQARQMIRDALAAEQATATGKLLGIAGGASGGDIIFHEVCEELGIASHVYLALPGNDYIKASVADAGADWVQRFSYLIDTKPTKFLADSTELPQSLGARSDLDIWQRTNLWMLYSASAISSGKLTLIALWNGEAGDAPGGTEDMVHRAQDRGATFIHLDTRTLTDKSRY